LVGHNNINIGLRLFSFSKINIRNIKAQIFRMEDINFIFIYFIVMKKSIYF